MKWNVFPIVNCKYMIKIHVCTKADYIWYIKMALNVPRIKCNLISMTKYASN